MIRTVRRSDEGGFTLIEVIVAVVLLGVIMPSVSLFFVSSIKASATFQRRDAATQLADEAMDLVRAVPAVIPGVIESTLLQGRSRGAVEAQWLTAPAGLDTITTPVWDDTPTGSPVVPLTVTKTVGQQAYTIDTFIGRCGQAADDTVCSETETQDEDEDSGPDGATFHRVVVRVAWSPGPGATCSGQPCEFLLTTVVNADNEPVFNTTVDLVRPVANDDDVTAVADQSVTVAVLDNDTGTFAVNPVTVLGTGPAHGTLTGTTASGTFTYTPDPGYSGSDTFKYRLTDSAGLRSDPATVTVTVALPPAPVANADSVTVASGDPVTVSVLDNDTGTLGADPVTIEVGPSRGTLTGSPATGTFTYTSQLGISGSDTIRYRLTDSYGRASDDVLVTVTVTVPPAPVASADSASTVGSQPVTVSLLGNATGAGGVFARLSGPASSAWRTPTGPSGNRGTVSVESIGPSANNGTFSMDYSFRDAQSRTTSATITIQVKNSC